MATLVLGDDQVVFLDALATVLTQHEHTVGAVTRSTAEMVAFVHHERPDACLIARHLARDDDVEAIGRVIAASKRTNVLVLSADPGFDAQNVLTMNLSLPTVKYAKPARQIAFFDEVLRRVLRLRRIAQQRKT